MRVRSALKWVFAFGVLALAAGRAGAQQPRRRRTAQRGQPAGQAQTMEGQVGFQRKTSLTPQEQLAESQKHLARMEGAAGGIPQNARGGTPPA